MEKITIRAFRAVDEPGLCELYIQEHARVLTEIGVIASLPIERDWMYDPRTIVICASHDELGMVAGVRLQSRIQGKLPLEKHLLPIDEGINAAIDAFGMRNAEMCGLWNAHRFAGRGIATHLLSAAVAVSPLSGFDSLVCLAAEYMVERCSQLGFRAIETIGEHGNFQFPSGYITSTCMALCDTTSMWQARLDKRKLILSLRLAPVQKKFSQGKGKQLEIQYSLMMDLAEAYRDVHWLRQRFAA